MPDPLTAETDRAYRWMVIAICAYGFAALAVLPIAGVSGPFIPGLTSLFAGVVLSTDLATSFLLFVWFGVERRWGLLVLACSYLFSGLMAVLHVLTFPGALISDVSVFGTPMSSAWPYQLWVGGYAALVLASFVIESCAREPLARAYIRPVIALGIGAIIVIVVAGALVIIRLADRFPPIIVDGKWSVMAVAVNYASEVMMAVSVAIGLLVAGRRNGLFLWLSLAVTAMLVANTMAIFSGSRYTLGWSLGRLSWIVSACVLLIFFLRRFSLQQSQLARARDTLEATVTDRTAQLVEQINQRQEQNLELTRVVDALRESEAGLRRSEERLDRAQAIANIGSWELDLTTGRYFWSKELFRMCGATADRFEPNAENIKSFVHADDWPLMLSWREGLIARGEARSLDIRLVRPDGENRFARLDGQALCDADGIVRRLVGTTQDVTERRLIERQLAQAQKLDALGTLTGGMAHDFNNLLAVIVANVELLHDRLGRDAESLELCGEIEDGATRGAELIGRLLAFARRQTLVPEPTDVNALVNGVSRMLRRTLGENVMLTVDLVPSLWPVMIDPVQLEAAIVNLATNARDAMPRGGRLEIATTKLQRDDVRIEQFPGLMPGDYVVITVSDTGTGMPPDTVAHIFDPFFTTKETGKGTGLGLSTAFGFIKQSGGHIDVSSEVGSGTMFRIYLPRSEITVPDKAMRAPDSSPSKRSGQLILVVDDNDQVRRVVVRQLVRLKYRTCEANGPTAALELLSGDDGIDLLLTDTVMPGSMSGLDLARQAQRLRPNLKIIMMSGFEGSTGGDGNAFTLLTKPFTSDRLENALREKLDGSAPGN